MTKKQEQLISDTCEWIESADPNLQERITQAKKKWKTTIKSGGVYSLSCWVQFFPMRFTALIDNDFIDKILHKL